MRYKQQLDKKKPQFSSLRKSWSQIILCARILDPCVYQDSQISRQNGQKDSNQSTAMLEKIESDWKQAISEPNNIL